MENFLMRVGNNSAKGTNSEAKPKKLIKIFYTKKSQKS